MHRSKKDPVLESFSRLSNRHLLPKNSLNRFYEAFFGKNSECEDIR